MTVTCKARPYPCQIQVKPSAERSEQRDSLRPGSGQASPLEHALCERMGMPAAQKNDTMAESYDSGRLPIDLFWTGEPIPRVVNSQEGTVYNAIRAAAIREIIQSRQYSE